MLRTRCVLAACATLLASWLFAPPPAAAARPLSIGYLDGLFRAPEAPVWLDRAAAQGADLIRLPASWGGLAPSRPSRPADPADPAYDWADLDIAVKAATSRRLAPLVSLTSAPAWAEGPGRPADASPGSWRPDPVAFGAFARALGRRYDGSFPDPASPGATLPRVRSFQPWNEPNLERYIAPQWVKRNGKFTATSPTIYRNLQNAFTKGIRAAQPKAVVATAGTAPYGDPFPGGSRIAPALFWRGVLCLNAKLKRVRGCGSVAFDALAHHPYSVGGPKRRALNADDVSVPDMGKLTRILKAAERARTAPGRHRLWVTEISWDSKPDDPNGLSERTQAAWLAQSFMVLWRQGVDTITWFQVRDAPGPDYAATAQSGTYRFNGRPKLSARAFAFPVAVERRTRSAARVWLRAPASGPVTLQTRRGGAWKTARRTAGRRHGVLEVTIATKGGTAVRARQGALTSLSAPLR